MKLEVEIAKKNKIADFKDPIGTIEVSQGEKNMIN